MLSERDTNHYISDADITKLVQLYFTELQRLESLFLAESTLKESQKKLVEVYQHEISKIISILRNISSQVFVSTNIGHVKNYKKVSETPEDLSNNFSVLQNVKNMVTCEIVNQKSPEHALISMERWISIIKTCHEQNDYFSAGAILYAVNSNAMNKSGLEEKLSPKSKSILLYFTSIYTRQDILQSIQVYQHENNKGVIPVLTALMNAIEKLSDKSVISDASLRRPYIEMQKRLQSSESYTDISDFSVLKLHERDEELDDIYLQLARELKSKLVTKNKKQKSKAYKCIMNSIYSDDDDYYLEKNELNKLCDNLKHSIIKLQDENYVVCSKIIKVLDDYTLNDIRKLESVKSILSSSKNINKSKFAKVISQLKYLASKWPSKQALVEPFDAESVESKTIESMSERVKLISESSATNSTYTRLTRSSSCKNLSMDKINRNDKNERYPQSSRVFRESSSEFKHGTLFSPSLHKSNSVIIPSIEICEASDLMSDSVITLTNLNATTTTNEKSSFSDAHSRASDNGLPVISSCESEFINQDSLRRSESLINPIYDTSTDIIDDKSHSDVDLIATRQKTVKHLSSKTRSYSVPLYSSVDETIMSSNDIPFADGNRKAKQYSTSLRPAKHSSGDINKNVEPPFLQATKPGIVSGNEVVNPAVSRQINTLTIPRDDKRAENVSEMKRTHRSMQSSARRSIVMKEFTETAPQPDSHKRHSPRGKK